MQAYTSARDSVFDERKSGNQSRLSSVKLCHCIDSCTDHSRLIRVNKNARYSIRGSLLRAEIQDDNLDKESWPNV